MKLHAFLLTFLLGLAVPALSQEGGEAQDGAPAAETTAVDPGAEAAADSGIDVDDVIAKYREETGDSRTFNAQEREWLAAGLPPGQVDNAHSGYAAIPTGDPNLVVIYRDGERQEIRSAADKNTPPATFSEFGHMMPYAPEVDEGSFWMPVAASSTSKDVDAMFDFIMWTCYIFTGVIGVLMVVFCIKYRRRPGVRADQSITHNTPLEIVWSVIPTILVAIMFWGGYVTFLDLRTAPPDAMKINVSAFRWGWNFQYQNGVESPSEFHVPENTPIEMVMTSTDVLHSFHLPAFRQKSDVLPNRYTKVWFDSGEPGEYRVYCTEYCGKSHSSMYAKLVVEPKEDYDRWLTKVGNWTVDDDGELKPPLEIGKLTYAKRACNSCHSIDGAAGTGPTFAGLWGRERNFDDGTSAVADENYIRQAILDPHSQVVVNEDTGASYGKQMTIYNPMLPIVQINGIIAFIESLKDVPRK